MTDSWVAVPPDSTGKKLRSDYTTTSGGTVVHTEFVRADHSPVVATNASFRVSVPGYVRVLNATAASFLVTATGGGFRNVTSNTAASFNVTVPIVANQPVSVAQILRLPTTRGSAVVQADHSLVIATNASFGVNVPGIVRVTGPASTASFIVGTPGYQKALNATYASFLAQISNTLPLQVKTGTTFASFLAIVASQSGGLLVKNSITSASLLAQVNVPGFVNIKGPTTRGSTVVQADHSLVLGTRASTIVQADHSALISVSAASFTVGAQGKTYTTVWPAAQSTGVYNPLTQDSLGRQVVILNTTPGKSESTVVNVTSAAITSLFGASAGNRHYITDIDIANTSATAVGITFVSGGLTVGKRMHYAYVAGVTLTTYAAISGAIHNADMVTPPFTNLGSTFACWLSRTVVNVKISVKGYQSTV